jgi:hypothetical protein
MVRTLISNNERLGVGGERKRKRERRREKEAKRRDTRFIVKQRREPSTPKLGPCDPVQQQTNTRAGPVRITDGTQLTLE